MIMSSGLLLLSFAFLTAAATRGTRSIVRAQMSAMFHLVDVNPGACRGPTPRIPDPLHHPGPPNDIVAPKSRCSSVTTAARQRQNRAEREFHRLARKTRHKTPKYKTGNNSNDLRSGPFFRPDATVYLCRSS